MTVVKLDDGREFPAYGDEALSWSVDLYCTPAEERLGYPRARAVVAAMREHRPEDLARYERELVRDSLGRMFGHNARRILAMVRGEAP